MFSLSKNIELIHLRERWVSIATLYGLDGKLEFYYWKPLMGTHLRAYNICTTVEIGLAGGADDTTRRRDQLAFGKIVNAKTAKEV